MSVSHSGFDAEWICVLLVVGCQPMTEFASETDIMIDGNESSTVQKEETIVAQTKRHGSQG